MESIDHLFIHCDVATSIWSYFLKECGVSWCFSGSLAEAFEAWRGAPMFGNSRILWRIIHFSILWSIWKERNGRTFNIKELTWVNLLSVAQVRIVKWACARKEFSDMKIDNFMQGWSDCLKKSKLKKKRKVSWCITLTSTRVLKFNVDGVARGKQGLASIGGVLRNHKGEVMYMFSKHVGIKDSNEAEVLVILEALRIYHPFYHHYLIVESDC